MAFELDVSSVEIDFDVLEGIDSEETFCRMLWHSDGVADAGLDQALEDSGVGSSEVLTVKAASVKDVREDENREYDFEIHVVVDDVPSVGESGKWKYGGGENEYYYRVVVHQ